MVLYLPSSKTGWCFKLHTFGLMFSENFTKKSVKLASNRHNINICFHFIAKKSVSSEFADLLAHFLSSFFNVFNLSGKSKHKINDKGSDQLVKCL